MTELETLKQKADLMGVNYSNNIGVDALRQKVNAALEGKSEDTDKPVTYASEIERKAALRKTQRAEMLKLVRIRVVCHNPTKSDLQGEIFTVSNKVLGSVRKFVPFGDANEEGWHVPYIIYKEIIARKYIAITKKRVDGREVINKQVAAEYGVEVLPALSKDELTKLAAKQSAAFATSGN